jgi:hypothetical protein
MVHTGADHFDIRGIKSGQLRPDYDAAVCRHQLRVELNF